MGSALQEATGLVWASPQKVGIMVLRIEFRISWAVSFCTISRNTLGGQTACSLVLITLAGTMKGREVLAPWLAEGVGRETRARIATRTETTSCIRTSSSSARINT